MIEIDIKINARPFRIAEGTTVAVAIALAGITTYRRSVLGEPRAPLCGMGICAECRVTINGQTQQLSCQTLCTDGMEVQTDALV